jgi:hypothetical protein
MFIEGVENLKTKSLWGTYIIKAFPKGSYTVRSATSSFAKL